MLWLWIVLGIVGAAGFTVSLIVIIKRTRVYLLDVADRFLIDEFSRCNVLVFGKKRQGKDLIFAHVIALRGGKHYSNIPYDGNTEVINLSELNVGENTFMDFINGTVKKFTPRFEEGCDVYISDGGIYLPCHFDKELDAKYPGMPIFFALSGQLYNLNVHLNSQAVGRPWKKLREQADSFIQVHGNTFRDGIFYVRISVYDKLANAESETKPIARFTVRVPIAELQYDTRYFREFLFDCVPQERDKILAYMLTR